MVHQTNPNREQFPSQRALVPLATLTLSDRFLRLILANFQCVTKYSRQMGYRDLRNTIQTRYGLRVSLVPTLAKQHDGQPVPPATRAKATLNPFQVSNIGLIGYHVVGFLVWRPPSHPSSLHSPHASTGTRHAWFRALGRIKQPPPSRNNPDQINPRPLAQKGSEEWPSSAMRTAKTTSKSHDTREYVLLDPMHASPWSEPNTQGGVLLTENTNSLHMSGLPKTPTISHREHALTSDSDVGDAFGLDSPPCLADDDGLILRRKQRRLTLPFEMCFSGGGRLAPLRCL
jgi:hypothetical protein